MTYTEIGNVLVVAGAIPALSSVLVFARVRWWESRWGRHLMAYMTAIAILLVLSVIRLAFGDAPWFAALRLVALAAVVVVLWWRLAYVVQALREGSPDDTATEGPPH